MNQDFHTATFHDKSLQNFHLSLFCHWLSVSKSAMKITTFLLKYTPISFPLTIPPT